MSYLEQRLNELGITPEENSIQINTLDRFNQPKQIYMPIFTANQNDDIDILVYTLDRQLIEYDHKDADPLHKTQNNDRTQHYHLTRLNPERVKDGTKYIMPKGKGVYPFIPPMLVDMYEHQTPIATLYLTEGYFKAFKAAKHGLPCVGLSSITHYANSKTKKIHPAISRLILTCQVKNVVMLYDGDCLNISTKALQNMEDLAKRPQGFFLSMLNVRELLLEYDVQIWFSNINSKDLRNQPKGLDDLYCEYRGEEKEITSELLNLDKATQYVFRMNVSVGLKRLQPYFNLKSVEQFYGAWEDIIGEREFIYFGSSYKLNTNNGRIEKTMPKELKNFMRVGDDYYEIVEMPVLYGSENISYDGETEKRMYKRRKSTIVDDFGKDLVNKIPKYKAFINMPSHTNYQQVIANCWNQYAPINHEPAPGDWSTIDMLLHHIFGEQYEIGLDYLQILYQYPTQILPILCLVSQERQTGKTTFIDFLKMVFGENCAKVGNAEISSQFNSFLTSRLIVAVDETNLEKNRDTTERLKMLSTTTRIFSQSKGVDHIEQAHFAKYILTSNFETNFIYTQEDEIRFWVRKIPHITNLIPTLLNDLHDEIPAFLYMLSQRKISKPKTSRMWFDPADLETEALKKLKDKQKPLIEREITAYVRELFLDFPADEYLFTIEALQQRIPLLQKKDNQHLHTILRENMHLQKYARDGRETAIRFKLPRWEAGNLYSDEAPTQIIWDKFHGRPYVFPREMFLTKQEIADQEAKQEQTEQTEQTEQAEQTKIPFQ